MSKLNRLTVGLFRADSKLKSGRHWSLINSSPSSLINSSAKSTGMMPDMPPSIVEEEQWKMSGLSLVDRHTGDDQAFLLASKLEIIKLGKTSKKKTAYFMTSGKKVGGPRTKTKFQKKI